MFEYAEFKRFELKFDELRLAEFKLFESQLVAEFPQLTPKLQHQELELPNQEPKLQRQELKLQQSEPKLQRQEPKLQLHQNNQIEVQLQLNTQDCGAFVSPRQVSR